MTETTGMTGMNDMADYNMTDTTEMTMIPIFLIFLFSTWLTGTNKQTNAVFRVASQLNKPSFCSGSCDECHATGNFF